MSAEADPKPRKSTTETYAQENTGAPQEESQNKPYSGILTLESVEAEARDFVLGGGQFTSGYLSRGAGKYILFKKTADGLMKYAYKCPNCGSGGGEFEQMTKPYIIKCKKCGTEIFKQEKVKGKGTGKKGRKKKEPKV